MVEQEQQQEQFLLLPPRRCKKRRRQNKKKKKITAASNKKLRGTDTTFFILFPLTRLDSTRLDMESAAKGARDDDVVAVRVRLSFFLSFFLLTASTKPQCQ